MIIADASVLAVALADDGADGDVARARLSGERIAVPELAYLEVVSVLRRLSTSGRMDSRRADLALADLSVLPLQVAGHITLLPRIWVLRANVTVYDAAYVALAEALDAVLLTADARLARSPTARCRFEVLLTREGGK